MEIKSYLCGRKATQMEYLNKFHKESTERCLKKIEGWQKCPMESHAAAAYMKKNMEEGERMWQDYLRSKGRRNA